MSDEARAEISFNSIKVQLRRRPPARAVRTLCAFQFHKGTIKAKREAITATSEAGFQFHKGTIKAFLVRGCFLQSALSIP